MDYTNLSGMLADPLRTVVAAAKLTTVEPYLFLCLLGYSGRLVSFQSLLMDRTCRITLGHPGEVCDDLDNHPTEEAECIAGGNNLYMGVMLSSSLPAVAAALFLGPWSDKYSRKLPLVFATGGMFLDSLAGAVLAAIPGASPLWFVGAALLSGLSGGFIICVSAAFSYLSDVTDESSRPARFAVLEFFTIAALVVGNLVGGQIFETLGFVAVMAAAPCCFAGAGLYSAFALRETRPPNAERTKGEMLRDLVSLDNVKQSYVACSRKRPGNIRMQIWMLVWISCCQRLCDMGTLAVGYPFARTMYRWGVAAFSNASTAFYVVNALVTLVVQPLLSNGLRLHEAAIGLVGMLSLIAKMVYTSVAYWDYMFYFAWMSGTLANGVGIAVRSRLSKLVDKEELGRAFSLLGTCESVTPLLGSLAFLQIYNATVGTFPGFAFAAAAVFLLPCAIIFVWMLRMPSISLAVFAKELEQRQWRPLQEIAAPPSPKPHRDTQEVY